MKVFGRESSTTIQTEKRYLAFYKSKGEVEALARLFKFGSKKFVETTYKKVSPRHFFYDGPSLAKGDKVMCRFECCSAK